MKFRNAFIEIVALLYVCLMLYTGISKLMAHEMTREQMAVMPLIGPVSGIVTWLLPLSEIVLAIALFIPATRMKGLYIGTGLMLIFTIYVAYIMQFHSHLPCTCGGLLQELTWSQHLIFNGAFVLLGALAILLGRKPIKAAEKSLLTYSN